MEKTHGTWGNRTKIFQNDSCLVTFLELESERRCSYHYHKQSWNQFFVISGVLGVKTDKGYTTKIYPGQCFTVEPGARHEFQVYDQITAVIEIAYVKYCENDIIRENVGGSLEEEKEEKQDFVSAPETPSHMRYGRVVGFHHGAPIVES